MTYFALVTVPVEVELLCDLCLCRWSFALRWTSIFAQNQPHGPAPVWTVGLRPCCRALWLTRRAVESGVRQKRSGVNRFWATHLFSWSKCKMAKHAREFHWLWPRSRSSDYYPSCLTGSWSWFWFQGWFPFISLKDIELLIVLVARNIVHTHLQSRILAGSVQ